MTIVTRHYDSPEKTIDQINDELMLYGYMVARTGKTVEGFIRYEIKCIHKMAKAEE